MRTTLIAAPLAIALATMAALAADPQIPVGDELLKNSMRIPFVTVPMGGGIHVDGDVRKGEWVHFTKLADLVTSIDQTDDNGTAAPEQTHVWMTYDDKALYIGFKVHMEKGRLPAQSVTEGRDHGFNDDAFEVFLTPPGAQQIYHFGGTAAGVLWDRTLAGAHADWSWNADVTYKVKLDEGNSWWVGEWRISFAAFGRATPQPGEAWRANFVSNRRTPFTRVDTWSYWKKWLDHDNSGVLIFGGRSPAFVMKHLVAEAWEKEGAMIAVGAPPDATIEQPYQIDYSYQLYCKPTPGGNSFLKELQARRDQATGEGATFAPFADDLKAALKDYKLIESPQKVQPVPPVGWTGPWGGRVKVDRPGDYVLAWRISDVTHKDKPVAIAGGAVPFRIRVGIQAEVWPFLLTRQSVVLKGDLRAVPGRDQVKTLRGQITPRGGGKALVEKTVEYAGERKQDVEVTGAASIPAGAEYEARLHALDASGNHYFQASRRSGLVGQSPEIRQ